MEKKQKMNKKMKNRKKEYKRGNMKVFFLIANLIIATFAFSWLDNQLLKKITEVT